MAADEPQLSYSELSEPLCSVKYCAYVQIVVNDRVYGMALSAVRANVCDSSF